MDPNEALGRLIDELVAGSTEGADEVFEDLCQWINGGGFKPTDPRVVRTQRCGRSSTHLAHSWTLAQRCDGGSSDAVGVKFCGRGQQHPPHGWMIGRVRYHCAGMRLTDVPTS